MFLLQYQRPSFTPIENDGKNYSSMYSRDILILKLSDERGVGRFILTMLPFVKICRLGVGEICIRRIEGDV
jgi:hypothetical protein